MAAESPRRSSKYNCTVVRPQPYSDKSVVESVVDFISDVVPQVQAYSGNQRNDDKEKITWVKFERCDINDITCNPNLYGGEQKILPLLLILGYNNGVQIWNITSNGDGQEILSLRQGPVRILKVLPTPDIGNCDNEKFASKRPLIAVCDSSSAGQPFCSVKFVSLRSGDEVHSVPFKTLPVHNIEATKRYIAVVFQEKIAVFDAWNLQELFRVSGCYPDSGLKINPIALGTRWLAYADRRLVAYHQSCGGMSGDGSQSYAATVISAAKKFGVLNRGAIKGLTMFGEAMVSSVTGNKPSPPTKRMEMTQPLDNGNHPGIVSVVDIPNIKDKQFSVTEDQECDGLIAHFHAHANEPLAAMAFDASGTLLITACKLGHNFHLFRLMAHPCSSSLGAVHHLYTLHRGETTAKVVDMTFTTDSRWLAVSTHRGTTHVFPITPYGGQVSVRTHCHPRVVNRVSRFQKSAGLGDIDGAAGRRSPVLSGSPGSSGHEHYPSLIRQNALNNNMGNPRLPPYPHPSNVYPLAQLKQHLALPALTSGMSTTSRQQSPSHSAGGTENIFNVSAYFAPSRHYVASSNLPVDRREGKKVVDSLFVIGQNGTLIEYSLEPHPKLTTEKPTDDSPLDLTCTGVIQWQLQRAKNSQEVKTPLPSNSPLLLATDAVMTQQPTLSPDELAPVSRHGSKDSLSSDHSSTSKDDLDTQWLSQVEIITHVGPHRRLWMGPQFSFKTIQNAQNTTVVSSTSSSLFSGSPDLHSSPMDMFVDDCDLESLKLQPTRSSPVAMPTARPAYRRASATEYAHSPNPHVSPLLIEAGSFDQSPNLNDVLCDWAESSMSRQPRSSEEEEDRLRETLADAMVESPLKDCGPTSIIMREDVFHHGSNETLSTSSGSSGSNLPSRGNDDSVFSSAVGGSDLVG
ncbi:BCAS3 microtubule associated cell migration factor isoform X1 [Patella vulgata]|uniref:BCAS3 microtubule associated cell migration factor isoform X1 n=1 Tax=Patella vulgata TaxID=6465 RepID=UPI00218031BA|nr:BCAS3 microtubule associated cell migration factor isoform X1 [Patella vulgata]